MALFSLKASQQMHGLLKYLICAHTCKAMTFCPTLKEEIGHLTYFQSIQNDKKFFSQDPFFQRKNKETSSKSRNLKNSSKMLYRDVTQNQIFILPFCRTTDSISFRKIEIFSLTSIFPSFLSLYIRVI